MENTENIDKIYETVLNTFIDQGVVFFGGYAVSMYSQYMPKHLRKKLEKVPDFDVLSEEPSKTAEIVKERLNDIGIKNVTIKKQSGIGEIIAPNYEIKVGNDTVAFIYQPLACHSYNLVKENGQEIKVATIDTMLSFYLAFLYGNKPYFDPERILCMSKYLFEVQEKNRLTQKGLLRRFSIKCIGHQETIEEMREEKAEKFKELKNNKNTLEYEEWFLRYRPADKKEEKLEEKLKQKNSKKTKINRKRTNKRRKTAKKVGFLF
jgi:hypothetical protein